VENHSTNPVSREGMNGGKGIGHVANRDRPEVFQLGSCALDGFLLFFRALGGADAHHQLDPGDEPAAPRHLSAQRGELDVRMGVDQPRQEDAAYLLDIGPRVSRQYFVGRPHVEDGAALVEYDRRIPERSLLAGQDRVGADDAGSHTGSVSQS
jgi:hypothetical protein